MILKGKKKEEIDLEKNNTLSSGQYKGNNFFFF